MWIAGFLFALDVLIIPSWTMWLDAYLIGSPGTMEVMGTLAPLWVCLALGPMAILSVAGVVALALTRNELGFRVASAVAVAWIAFLGIAFVTGAMPVGPFLGRLVILMILVSGRGVRPATIGVLTS